MRLAATLLAVAGLALLAPGRAGGAPPALAKEDLDAWLEGFLPYAIARDDIAGAAVVVVKDGEILAQGGYGFADVGRRVRIDPARTLFRTGSVGKLFTWTAVMQQVEAGRLALDRDVNVGLDFGIPPREGRPVTLRNLMTHTPGFEEPVKRLVTDRPERLPTPAAYLKAWTPARIFAPGEVPAYSNYGVTLAGYLVERATGENYDDYVDRHVFGPLGMTRSTTRQPLPEPLRGDMSQGYLLASGPAQPFELFGVAPAGGASTTVADMGRFMIAWLQGGTIDGARILRPDTVRQVFGTKLPVVPPLNAMLLGFYEKNLNGRRIAGHDGDSQFFHSSLDLYVDDGVGVYVVVNSSGRNGAAGTLLARFRSEFADRYFPAQETAVTVSAEAAAEHVRQVAGTYMSSRRQESNLFRVLAFLSQVRVTAGEDGGLLVPALVDAGGEPMRWREVQPYVWDQVGGKERLAARLRDGRAELIGVNSSSPFLVLQPAPWWISSTVFAPLLAISIAVVFGSLIAWMVTALLRRHYRLWPANAGPAGRPYRWTRIACAATLAILACWMMLFAQLDGNLFAYSPALDPAVSLLKIATTLSCAGGLAAAAWDLLQPAAGRGWASRVSSVALAVSFAILLWLAVVLKLAGFGTDY
ncbi:MAG TPA: serine hydrolase domain-containing protein [Steroidobacteraceae bacterium]|nr:serine hydrolase domain-containing protein [Steroidobacteraceae bacterium]